MQPSSPSNCFTHHTCFSPDSPVSIALCAPTTGFCRQLEQQIANTLQVLAAWCHEVRAGELTAWSVCVYCLLLCELQVKEDKECIAAVAGGGAWEIAMIKQLEACINDQQITM